MGGPGSPNFWINEKTSVYFRNTRSGIASAILTGLMSTCALDSVSAVLNLKATYKAKLKALRTLFQLKRPFKGPRRIKRSHWGHTFISTRSLKFARIIFLPQHHTSKQCSCVCDKISAIYRHCFEIYFEIYRWIKLYDWEEPKRTTFL